MVIGEDFMSKQLETIMRRQETYLPKSARILYLPISFVRGKGAKLYDCDGNECTSHVEWRKVFHEKTAHYDWLVDNVIAKAYGVLMCAMV